MVYEEYCYTLEQIRDGLLANFEGYDELRRDCLNAPKFGNDDDYVDQYALDITEWTERECRKYDMLYSTLSHGTLSISNNTPIGELTAASANGSFSVDATLGWYQPNTRCGQTSLLPSSNQSAR